jgi:hypothetical protein
MDLAREATLCPGRSVLPAACRCADANVYSWCIIAVSYLTHSLTIRQSSITGVILASTARENTVKIKVAPSSSCEGLVLRAGRRARNVPVWIDVISSVGHGRGCVGAVTRAMGWTATERRYVEGES